MKRMVLLASMILLGVPGIVQAASAPEATTVLAVYPALTSGALSKATLAELPEGVILRAGKLEVRTAAIDRQVAQAPETIRKEFEKNKFFLLENFATGQILLQEAKPADQAETGADLNKVIQTYLQGIAGKAEVSAEEVKAFYEENKSLIGDIPFAQAEQDLKGYLLQQKQQKLLREHIRTLGDRTPIRVDRAWTAAQAKLAMDNPVDHARASGKPSMVDFEAHGCPFCKMMTPIMADLKNKHAGKANVLVISTEAEKILSIRYGVSSIPVQIFFDRKGKEIFRHTGYLPQEECEKWLRKAEGE